MRPRLGLALSGGGFRAAFFHIGVLAQMARLRLLRHVEVLSTVSGGSVVGALYYLLLKRLLEETVDAAITDEDYCRLVVRLEDLFFKAVQKNLRVRSLLNPIDLIRTGSPRYSRTDHLGELLDSYFYRPAVDPKRTKPVLMRELRIRPKGAPADFHPYRHNSDRAAKVPILLLNATTLNTGHNWRFEATRLGEPQMQTALLHDVDKLFRLRRPSSYEDVTPRHRNIELGIAVAASCCVPGLFPPLALSRLYDRKIRVQLVDGAVHDNHGLDGLLDHACTDFVISDGSDQMCAEIDPGAQLVPVIRRSMDILGSQLRAEALLRLMEPNMHRVALVHLRKSLSVEAIAWLDQDDRPAAPVKEEQVPRATFGVPEETQEVLSHMRTDLDAFTEVEAYSLMLDAYAMGATELRNIAGASSQPVSEENCRWRFLEVEPWLRQPTPQYRRRLELARHRFLRLFLLKWQLTLVLLPVVLAGLICLVSSTLSWTNVWHGLLWCVPLFVPLLLVLLTLVLIFLPQFVDRLPYRVRMPLQVGGGFLLRFAAAFIICPASAFQLYVLYPLYQREGRLARLGQPPRTPGS